MNLHLGSLKSTSLDVTYMPAASPNSVNVYLGPFGMFMTPQEARELATKLLNAAVQAEVAA